MIGLFPVFLRVIIVSADAVQPNKSGSVIVFVSRAYAGTITSPLKPIFNVSLQEPAVYGIDNNLEKIPSALAAYLTVIDAVLPASIIKGNTVGLIIEKGELTLQLVIDKELVPLFIIVITVS